MTHPHTFNNCRLSSGCDDPCNGIHGAKSEGCELFWSEEGCRITARSQRCRNYVCRRCKDWLPLEVA
jgi:hypothetical protein